MEEKNIQEMETRLKSYDVDIENLEEELNIADFQEIPGISAQLENLRAEREALRQEMEKAISERGEVDKESQLASNIEDLKARIASYEVDIENLENELMTASAEEIPGISEQLENLRSELENLKNELVLKTGEFEKETGKTYELYQKEQAIKDIETQIKSIDADIERLEEELMTADFQEQPGISEELDRLRKEREELVKRKEELSKTIKKEPKQKNEKEANGTNKIKEEDGKDKKNKENLPIRSFWEIYDSTCTQTCGTVPGVIHKMANAPLFSLKGQDTVQKVLSVIPNILMVIPKLISKPINMALGTNKKFDELRNNIEGLSEAEFEVLTESKTPHRDERDTDYLSPTFMKQHKVNNLYLDAVNNVLKAKQSDVIQKANTGIVEIEKRINELQDKREQDPNSLTPEDLKELEQLGKLKESLKEMGDEASNKAKLFQTGAKEKTSGFRNISGWVAGKYNPDNRLYNHEMAKLAKQRREAIQRGDQAEVTLIKQKMDNLADSKTNVVQVGSNENNKIDRGLTSSDKTHRCELLDKGPQTKTQLFISNLAVGASIARFAEIIKNNAIIRAQKAEIARGNEANKNIGYEGEQQVVDSTQIDAAAKEYAGKVGSGAHAKGEYANLDARANEVGGSWVKGINTKEYHTQDAALHTATTNTAEQIAGQTPIEAVKTATNYGNQIDTEALKISTEYAAQHGFDYSGYMDMLKQGIDNSGAFTKLLESLGDGTAHISGVVSGEMINDLLVGLSNKADLAMMATIYAGIVNARGKDIMNKPVDQPRENPKGEKNKEEKAEEEQQRQEQVEASNQISTGNVTTGPVTTAGPVTTTDDLLKEKADDEMDR